MKLHCSGIRLMVVLLVCMVSGWWATAQQSHFMYIQSDNKAPFYVVLDKKTYNSNGTGYLIVSKIAGGKHSFILGFPDNKYPVQSFTCTIDDADAGYALKNFGDKGWGLYNLQTMAVTMGTEAGDAAKGGKTTADAPDVRPATNQFGDMLSQVVDDPTLQHKTVQPIKQPVKKETKAAVVTVDTVVLADTAAAIPDENAAEAAATRGVIKAGEKAGKEGVGYVFIDFNSKGADTVKVFIPATEAFQPETDTAVATVTAGAVLVDSVVVAGESAQLPAVKGDKKKKNAPVFVETDSAEVAKPVVEGATVSNPFYTKPAAGVARPEKTEASVDTAVTVYTEKAPAVSYNSNCSGGMAVDKDLDKLKKKMVGESSEDKMVAVAKKAFKSKCYTTEQIKELGRLFYTDESRYHFYDASYPFVYDVTNFSSLESMLLDDYYKKRFRAMLHL